MVKHYDSVFTSKQNEEIHKLLQRPQWSFAGGGSIEDGFTSFFWHLDGLEKDVYFLHLFKEIQERFLQGKDTELVRCYANGQTAGQSGVPHTDDGDITILYFPNNWKGYWGGHLNFSDGKDITKVIEYKQNRLVKFDANILHYASAPVMTFFGLRMSLAFKIKVK